MPESVARIAYLSYDGLTDTLGQSQILPYILGLEEQGFEFCIFSFEKKSSFESGKAKVEQLITGRKIEWHPLPYHKYPPVISTLFDIVVLKATLQKEWQKKPFQIIHCRSYITTLVGQAMKRSKKIRFIFDMRGFWADERVEGGLWRLSNPLYQVIYQYFKKKEKQFLSEADYIVSLTENAKQEILSWKIKTAPIVVIPTCVDLVFFNPENINVKDQDELRFKLEITKNAFVLLYLGSWGTWYLTKEMFQFFEQVRTRKPEAIFLIVTPDFVEIPSVFKSFVRVTQVSRESVPLLISISSGAVAFIKPSFSKKASSATKLAEILAMKVPIVSNAGWGDTGLMQTMGVKIIPTMIPDALEQGVNHLFDAPKSSSNLTLQPLSLSTGINRYAEIYHALLGV